MPYIKPQDRDAVISDQIPETAGELNYLITKMCHEHLKFHGVNYRNINAVIGVLECAKASLIETVLIPYEKIKMKGNGNISELDKKYYETL